MRSRSDVTASWTGGSHGSQSLLELSSAAQHSVERIMSDPVVRAKKGASASGTHSFVENMAIVWENIRSIMLDPEPNRPARAHPILFSFCELVPFSLPSADLLPAMQRVCAQAGSRNTRPTISHAEPAHVCQVLEVVPESRQIRRGWFESWWTLWQKQVSELGARSLRCDGCDVIAHAVT